MSAIIDSVNDRLRKAGYRFKSKVASLDGTSLNFWDNGKQTIILHDYKTDGFEVYKPASASNDVEKTLKAIGV